MPHPTDEDKREYLRLAIEEAKLGVHAGRGGPFGAVVIKGGAVVAKTSNGVIAGLDPTAHAEVEVVRLACRRLESFSLTDCDVYSSCEPCPMCLFALCWARPRAVYYTATRMDAASAGFDDERFYEACLLQPKALPFFYQRVIVEGSTEPFAEYASIASRVLY